MKVLTSFLRYLLMSGMLIGCVEPYDPPVNDNDVNFLVVDAFLDAAKGTATVSLTRSIPVKSAEPFPPETGAIVGVEDNQGVYYPLMESGTGSYQGTIANVSTQNDYRLIIRTSGNREYMSDFIKIIETPAIDSVTWAAKNDGVEIAVNMHDPSGASRHYRWKYTETYEYNATFNSVYMFTGNGIEIINRTRSESLFWCWKTQPSTDILVGSTKHLKEAVISRHPILFIPKESLKLSVRYSILVQQQALSEDAYEYWLNLEKSTEHLGGLFDPLPAEVSGNIYSLNNPGETVIGFFFGGTTKESRLFIERRQLPEEILAGFNRNPSCEVDTVFLNELENVPQSIRLLVDGVYFPGGPLVGYTTSVRSCADCRILGGSTTRPPFWD